MIGVINAKPVIQIPAIKPIPEVFEMRALEVYGNANTNSADTAKMKNRFFGVASLRDKTPPE